MRQCKSTYNFSPLPLPHTLSLTPCPLHPVPRTLPHSHRVSSHFSTSLFFLTWESVWRSALGQPSSGHWWSRTLHSLMATSQESSSVGRRRGGGGRAIHGHILWYTIMTTLCENCYFSPPPPPPQVVR